MLERAGLITAGRDATRRPRKIEPAPMADADDWLQKFRAMWGTRYRQLDSLLGELQGVAPR